MTWQWGGEGGVKRGAGSDAEPRGWALWEHGSQARGVDIIGRADRALRRGEARGHHVKSRPAFIGIGNGAR
jgi:hypothetical protein